MPARSAGTHEKGHPRGMPLQPGNDNSLSCGHYSRDTSRWTISKKRFALICEWKSRRTRNPAYRPTKRTMRRCAGSGT